MSEPFVPLPPPSHRPGSRRWKLAATLMAAGIAVGLWHNAKQTPTGPQPQLRPQPQTAAAPPPPARQPPPAQPVRPAAAPARKDAAPPPAVAQATPPAAADRHRVFRWVTPDGAVVFGNPDEPPPGAVAVPVDTDANVIAAPPHVEAETKPQSRGRDPEVPKDLEGMPALSYQKQMCEELRKLGGGGALKSLESGAAAALLKSCEGAGP